MTLKAEVISEMRIMKIVNLIKSLLKAERTRTSTQDREVLAELEGENRANAFSK
jgi:hypothetical protein